jgi:hypothetical protein
VAGVWGYCYNVRSSGFLLNLASWLATIAAGTGAIISTDSAMHRFFLTVNKYVLFLVSLFLLLTQPLLFVLIAFLSLLLPGSFSPPPADYHPVGLEFLFLLGLGFASGALAIWSIAKASKAQIFANDSLMAELSTLLDLRKLRQRVSSLFVTRAVSRSFLDPFQRNYKFGGSTYGGAEMSIDNDPGMSDRWIAEYVDLCAETNALQAIEHLRVSAALPVAFPLGYSVHGEPVVDGGLADNVPVLPVLRTGVDWIIVVDLKPQIMTATKLRATVISKWVASCAPLLSESTATALYRQWVKNPVVNYDDWFSNQPDLSGKLVTIIAPPRPLALLRHFPFLTGTLNPMRRFRKAWFTLGYAETSRTFPSGTFQYEGGLGAPSLGRKMPPIGQVIKLPESSGQGSWSSVARTAPSATKGVKARNTAADTDAVVTPRDSSLDARWYKNPLFWLPLCFSTLIAVSMIRHCPPSPVTLPVIVNIVDQSKETPIPGARVHVDQLGQIGQTGSQTAQTDSQGSCTFAVPPGVSRLHFTVEKTGFQRTELELEFLSDLRPIRIPLQSSAASEAQSRLTRRLVWVRVIVIGDAWDQRIQRARVQADAKIGGALDTDNQGVSILLVHANLKKVRITVSKPGYRPQSIDLNIFDGTDNIARLRLVRTRPRTLPAWSSAPKGPRPAG